MKVFGNTTGTLLLIAFCLVCHPTGVMAQQTAGQRFEKALYLEEVNGKLQQAIDQYQLILKEYPANREIIAKTQLHLGICYEKLGLNQARENYQAVINQFPEQLSVVKIARERMSRLDSFTSGTTLKAEQAFRQAGEFFRELKYDSAAAEYEKVMQLVPKSRLAEEARLWTGQCYFKLGKYEQALASFNSIIREFPQSTIVPVAELMIGQVKQAMAKEPKMSTVITLDDKTILDTATGIRYTKIKTWAGKYDVIKSAASITDIAPNRKFLLADNMVIPFEKGDVFNLTDTTSSVWTTSCRLSPDASRIAYFTYNAISVIPVSPESGHPSGSTNKLIERKSTTYHSAYSTLSWSPDGEKLVFTFFDGNYQANLWTLSTKDSSLKQVTRINGIVFDPVFSKAGNNMLYKCRLNALEDYDAGFYSIILGSCSREKSVTILDSCRYRDRFILSPDNHWIVYSKTPGNNPYLLRLSDNQKRELSVPEEVGEFVSWADNGSKVFFYRSSYEAQNLLRVASVFGGPSFEFGKQTGKWPVTWLPDSKGILFLDKGEDGTSGLKMINLITHESKAIAGTENPGAFPSFSPDGSAILTGLNWPGKQTDLSIIPFSAKECKVTGKPVVIFPGFDGLGSEDCSWSADGKKIALCQGGEVWISNVEGGGPRQLTRTAVIESCPRWSPDGTMIAVYTRTTHQLRMINASDGEVIRTVEPVEERFDWLPGGKEILVAHPDGQLSAISLESGKSHDFARLNEPNPGFDEMKFSPDGNWIAVNIYDKNATAYHSHIFLINTTDGKVSEAGSGEPGKKILVIWSPDSKWISYSHIMTPLSDESRKVRLEGTLWEANLTDFMKKIESGKEAGWLMDFK